MTKPGSTHRALRAVFDEATVRSDALTTDAVAQLWVSASGRLLQPARYGGFGGRTDQFASTVCDLASLDGSVGWLTAMLNAAAHEVAELPDPAADTVWGQDPGALIGVGHRGAGVLGRRRRLNGRWESVVAAEYADWFLLSTATDGGPCRVLVPRAAACTQAVGVRSGLLAAGVRDVTVSNVTVDERFVVRGDRRPDVVVTAAGLAAAVVGSADGVRRRHVEQVRARLATSYGGEEVTEEAAAQVAWAASDIDAATLQVAGSLAAPLGDAEALWACEQAVARAREAADRVLEHSRHALDASDTVARHWRDVHAGCRLAARLLDDLASGGP